MNNMNIEDVTNEILKFLNENVKLSDQWVNFVYTNGKLHIKLVIDCPFDMDNLETIINNKAESICCNAKYDTEISTMDNIRIFDKSLNEREIFMLQNELFGDQSGLAFYKAKKWQWIMIDKSNNSYEITRHLNKKEAKNHLKSGMWFSMKKINQTKKYL